MSRAQVLAFMAAFIAATKGNRSAEVYLVPLYTCAALGAKGEN